MVKFSIITCTYNSAAYVEKNIASVRQQTNRDFEHIFIDGFSDDGTVALIKEYQRDFPDQVKLFQYPRAGISDAMNKGIEHAQGQYINHLHSDDTYDNADVLKTVAQYCDTYRQPAWLYGKARFVDEVTGLSRIIPHRRIYHKIRFWLLTLTDYAPHQAIFLQASVFKQYGMFNTAYKNRMDYDMWLRLSKHKVKSQFMDTVICNFSLRPESQSVAFRYNQEHVSILHNHLSHPILIKALIALANFNQSRKLF